MSDDGRVVTLTIPMPAQGTNHAYQPRAVKRKSGKIGASLMHTAAHRDWEAMAMARLEEGVGVDWAIAPGDFRPREPLGLTFDWFFKDRRSDIDSKRKLIQDLVFDYLSLFVVATYDAKKKKWRPGRANDLEVAGDHANRHYDKSDPHVVVTVTTLAAFNARYGADAER